jgi:hypothetical protein
MNLLTNSLKTFSNPLQKHYSSDLALHACRKPLMIMKSLSESRRDNKLILADFFGIQCEMDAGENLPMAEEGSTRRISVSVFRICK